MGRNLIIDLWYGDTLSDCDGIDICWSDCDCVYRGNLRKSGRMVGDFTAKSWDAIAKAWESAHK